ncbi:hypothetical protein BHE74_00053578 [Ensete ventricosum]|nr:hypothetical protein BHE74_00053578 [Ensete ventricosum]
MSPSATADKSPPHHRAPPSPRNPRLLLKDFVVAHRILRSTLMRVLTNPSAPAVAKRAAESQCRDAAPPSKKRDPQSSGRSHLSIATATGDVTIVLGNASSLWLLRRMADAASSADRPRQRLLSSSDNSSWIPYRGRIANAADPRHDTSVGRPLDDPNRWLLYDRRPRPRPIDNVPSPRLALMRRGCRRFTASQVACQLAQLGQIWSKMILTNQNSTPNEEPISTAVTPQPSPALKQCELIEVDLTALNAKHLIMPSI